MFIFYIVSYFAGIKNPPIFSEGEASAVFGKGFFVLPPFFRADGVLDEVKLEAAWPENLHAAFRAAEIDIFVFADKLGIDGVSAFAAFPDWLDAKKLQKKLAKGLAPARDAVVAARPFPCFIVLSFEEGFKESFLLFLE